MNLKQSIKDLINRLPRGYVPVRERTVRDSRSEPSQQASGFSVDRIHSVVTAAELGMTRDLFSLYRDVIVTDSHLQAELFKRKLAILGDVISYLPFDKSLPADVETADNVSKMMSEIPSWTRACSHLLDSTLYPVSVLEKVFTPTDTGYAIARLIPVPYQLLDFQDGHLKIFETDDRGNPTNVRNDPDPSRYIIHRGHLLTSPDNWGGPMRSILFWWLLSAMDREWWTRFLDRYGSPFLVGKFHDEEGRSILQQAFSLATRLGGLVISKDTEAEIQQAAASDSGDAYEKFLSICQREKSKLIVGQTLSSEAQATGMNSGNAQLHENVRQDIRKFDAHMLGETLHDQLIVQYCSINNLPGHAPTMSWGSETNAKVQSRVTLLKALSDANLQLTDAALYSLSEEMGIEIERKSAGSFGGAPSPLSIGTAHIPDVSNATTVAISQAFRGSLAPIGRIIRESKSPNECQERIKTFCVSFSSERANRILAEALTAYTLQGSLPRRQ